MIDIETLKANFAKFCEENGLMNNWVMLKEYYISDNFYDRNDNVWDEISYLDGDRNPSWEENQENLEIDLDGWFKSDYPKCPDDFPINGDIVQALFDDGCMTDDTENQWNNIENLGFKFYKDLSEEMKEQIDSWWDDIVTVEYLEDLEDNAWILEGLGLGDLEENYSISAFIDKLAYWTVYFEPCKADWNVAWQSNLYPFKYYNTFMLALGACGMDLSPQLDCYQALVDGTLPRDSKIFRDPSYFDYVSPIKHDVILDKCRRERMKVEFTAEVKD